MRIGHTAKIGIGLGLLDRGLQLDKLCLRLVELVVESGSARLVFIEVET